MSSSLKGILNSNEIFQRHFLLFYFPFLAWIANYLFQIGDWRLSWSSLRHSLILTLIFLSLHQWLFLLPGGSISPLACRLLLAFHSPGIGDSPRPWHQERRGEPLPIVQRRLHPRRAQRPAPAATPATAESEHSHNFVASFINSDVDAAVIVVVDDQRERRRRRQERFERRCSPAELLRWNWCLLKLFWGDWKVAASFILKNKKFIQWKIHLISALMCSEGHYRYQALGVTSG